MGTSFTPVKILDIRPYGADPDKDATFFLLRLEHPRDSKAMPLWKDWKPGQFAMLRPAGWSFELPWARPLSICDVHDDSLTFFFQVVGRGTTRMSTLRPGDIIHLWGPLGNGFTVEADSPTLMLAGGIGLAPFVGYSRAHPKPENLRLLFAHRPPAHCYPLEYCEAVRPEDRQENSLEDRERFLDEVAAEIKKTAQQSGLVLACGPTPFLSLVQKVALESGCRTQISLENRMACGVGACLGCVTQPTVAHPIGGKDLLPLRTCINGPVFWADQVKL